MIHFFCPHCDTMLTAVGERAGTETVCSNCQHTLFVPQSPLHAADQPSKPAPPPAGPAASQWSDAHTPAATPAGRQNFTAPPPDQGMAIAALVLGICSLVMFWCVLMGAPLAVLAIVFGLMGMNKQPGHGMATAGFVMGLIELGLTVLMLVSGGMRMHWGHWWNSF